MILLLLAACRSGDTPPPADVDSGAGGDTDATAPVAMDVQAEVLDAVTTVVRVTWTTTSASTGFVEFGEGDTYGTSTPSTPEGTEHEVLLLGNPAETDVHFRVVTGAGAATEDHVVTTGSLPAVVPELQVTGEATGWTGFQALVFQGTVDVVTVLDTAGRVVWYHELEEDLNSPRADLSRDGASVLVVRGGAGEDRDAGTIVRIPITGGVEELVDLDAVHHDFVQHADGTIGALFIESRDGWGSAADGIVELLPDGTQREVFTAWDAFDPAEFGANEATHSWTHANALDYDEDTDTYYMSMRSLGSLVAVDGATGDVLWTLFGRAGTFAITDMEASSTDHHQFDLVDGGVLFFDNSSFERDHSKLLEYAVDTVAMTAEPTWTYTRDPQVLVWALGDAERLDDGVTQVVWSTSGEIQNVDVDGNVLWQLNSALGYALGYASFVPSLYP